MRFNALLFALLAGSLATSAVAAEWGRLHAAPMPEPGLAGPPHHSKMFVAQSAIANGSSRLDIPLDAESEAVLVVFGEHPVAARSPRGRELPGVPFRNEALESMDVPSLGARIELESLGRGSHGVDIESARRNGTLRYAVLQPESALEMTVQLAPLAASAGEPVTITATLAGTDAETTRVTAKVRGAGTVTLADDGDGADAAANDGVHTGRFQAPRVKGLRETAIRVDAHGHLRDGTRFRRTGGAMVMVSERGLALGAGDIEVRDDMLRVPLAGARGNYRVEAIYGAAGKTLAFARDERKLRGKPATHVELPRPEPAAAADRVVIRVLDIESLAVAAQVALDLDPRQAGVRDEPVAAPRMPASKAAAAQRQETQGAER